MSSLVASLDDADLTKLADAIQRGGLRIESAATFVEDKFGFHGDTLDLIIRLIRHWNGSKESLAIALRAAVQVRQNTKAEADTVNLVWTGPVQFGVPVRSTMAVTREMILAARNRITIVGYRITQGAKPVFDALAKQHDRGIKVTIILDEARNQKSVLSGLWPKSTPFPLVYGNEDEGTLHAKLTLVDGIDMLVTSANLTHRGFRSNVEIGVRISGPSSSKVDALLNTLIKDGHFRPV